MFDRYRIALSLPLVVALLLLAGCGGDSAQNPTASIAAGQPDTGAGAAAAPAGPAAAPARREVVQPQPEVIVKTNHGSVRLRLFPDKAPVTVNNFLTDYVKRGFYSGTVFHYVAPGSMVLGGGYTAEMELKSTRAEITCEADNGLSNRRGTVAMARRSDFAHSANSQFFINLSDNDFFDYENRETPEQFGYCVFGEVVEGLEVLDEIAQVKVAKTEISESQPVKPVVIESIELVK